MRIRAFIDRTARAAVALRAMLNGSETELFSVAAATAATHAARLEQIKTPNLIGTSTDAAASVGYSGEVKSSIVLFGSPVALTTNTPLTVAGLTLTPGRWRVVGIVGFIPDPLTSIALFAGGISLVNDALPADGNRAQSSFAAQVPGQLRTCITVPEVGISVNVNTPVYLTCSSLFTVAGVGGFGRITATRI